MYAYFIYAKNKRTTLSDWTELNSHLHKWRDVFLYFLYERAIE